MGAIVDELANHYPGPWWPRASTPSRPCGFRYATQSGITISIDDVRTPEKAAILEAHEKDADKVEGQFRRASSPTASAARRKSRSGPTPPTEVQGHGEGSSRPSSSTLSR